MQVRERKPRDTNPIITVITDFLSHSEEVNFCSSLIIIIMMMMIVNLEEYNILRIPRFISISQTQISRLQKAYDKKIMKY